MDTLVIIANSDHVMLLTVLTVVLRHSMVSAAFAYVQLVILVRHVKTHHVIQTINVSIKEHVLFKDLDFHVIALTDSPVNFVK